MAYGGLGVVWATEERMCRSVFLFIYFILFTSVFNSDVVSSRIISFVRMQRWGREQQQRNDGT